MKNLLTNRGTSAIMKVQKERGTTKCLLDTLTATIFFMTEAKELKELSTQSALVKKLFLPSGLTALTDLAKELSPAQALSSARTFKQKW